MKLNFNSGLGLALASGLLTWPLTILGQWLAPVIDLPFSDWQTILIGLSFGLLVMSPFIKVKSFAGIRVVVLCLASFVIYMLVTRLAINGFWIPGMGIKPALIFAGLLGALLVALSIQLLGGYRFNFKRWPIPGIAGTLGAIPFAVTTESNHDWETVLAYVIWQVLVYVGLYLSFKKPAT